MKNKLLLLALGVFFISSCSDMRYAGMQKVKHHPKSAVEAKNNEERKTQPEIKAIDKIEAEQLVINETSPSSPQIEKPQAERAEKSTVPSKIAKVTKKFFPKISEKIQKDESKISERKSIENKQTVKENKIEKGSWLWYVVVGLVLILIGGLFAGDIGYIFWLVGIILLIYGLLVLLEVI